MDKDTMEKYIQAGKIAKLAIERSKKIIKEGTSITEAAEKIEAEITGNGGSIAFPVNISSNDTAAHDTAFPDDARTFQQNDVIKVDIGAHIDGYIADTATTISFGGNMQDMIKASEEALKNAIKIATPGTKISEIGETIETTIKSYGYKPISNLSGHYLGRFIIHTGTSIPNIKINSAATLKEGDAIAIEPFATDGAGAIRDGSRSTIFRLIQKKPTRMDAARKLMTDIEKKYQTLPFAERWITGLKGFMREQAIRELTKRGALHQYPVLKEIGKGTVTQAEHTVLVFDKPIVTTA